MDNRLRELTEKLTIRDAELRESERTFKTLFCINPVPMCLTSTADGRFLKVNKAFEHLSGYTENELMGQTAVGLGFYANSVDREQVVNLVDSMGSIKNMPIKVRNKSGLIIETEFSTSVIELNGEKVFITVIIDTTERIESALALKDSEGRFASAFEISPIPTAISDLEHGRFFNVNQSFLDLFGYTKEELIGKTSLELGILNPDDRRIIEEQVKECGKIRNIKLRAKTKDGHFRVLLFSAALLNIDKSLLITAGLDVTLREEDNEDEWREKIFQRTD